MGGKDYKTTAEKRRCSKKRKFSGNRWTMKKAMAENEEADSNVDTHTGEGSVSYVSDNLIEVDDISSTRTINDETANTPNASARKIDLSVYNTEENDEENEETSAENHKLDDDKCLYMFVDVSILKNMLKLVGKCPECNENIMPDIDTCSKKGLANMIVMKCGNDRCGWEFKTYTSSRLESSKRFDVNVRSVMSFREIGRGLSHIETFSRVMNMPPPYSHSSYDKIVKEITPHYIDAMKDSMVAAASNVKSPKNDSGEDGLDIDADDVDVAHQSGVIDCDVSIDGSWQRRGYASLNGFVSCIERCNDKVVDVDVMTKDCKSCKLWKGKESTPEYLDWVQSHECPINHVGSSGSMETEGAVRIFCRSIEENKLRYTNYIGDGDSSAYKSVSEKKPYGDDCQIQKLECVGHIQKRVGAGLMVILKENKGIGGHGQGKLTRKVISTLQNYYGIAIRNNKDKTIVEMKMAIAAVLLHCTEKQGVERDERHKFCPKGEDTWCKYQKSKLTGEEFKGERINISEDIYKLIRPLWLRLSDNTLLEKCMHGRTQNVNESFNAFVWKRAPKDVFVGKMIFDMAVASAVVAFNDGASGYFLFLRKVGLHVGHYNKSLSHNADLERISSMQYKNTDKQKLRRKKLHAQKKGFITLQDKHYGAGMH